MAGFFQPLDRLVAGDGREIVEKLIERVAAFELVDQILEWDARPFEDHSAPQNLRIGMKDRTLVHGRTLTLRGRSGKHLLALPAVSQSHQPTLPGRCRSTPMQVSINHQHSTIN